jgi:pyruvate,orthophosphate dikinase
MTHIYSLHGEYEDKAQLGNKGVNLVTMTSLGLPVPPGFIVPVDSYAQYRETGTLPDEAIEQALAGLENEAQKKLGQGLKVSVRSSAPVSMPGMMDTVLNIGEVNQMKAALQRVFESWDNLRAVEYRHINKIPADLGTAAIVQAMVYGNKDSRSGTGVVFTRNPNSGDKGLFGEYLSQAQGEQLVSGTRTPMPIAILKSLMPEVYAELETIANLLETHYRDIQDIEFTVESGELHTLQTRTGKRSGYAAVKIAVDMVKERIITREEAILRITVDDLRALLHKRIREPESYQPLVKGLNAAPGAASGKVMFDALEAVALAEKSVPVILVRPETSPDDIQGIAAADGVLTQKGGLTSHAAIVTRAMGKPCVCGADDISVDLSSKHFAARGQIINQGDEITLDGTTGNVYIGLLPLEEANLITELEELMMWADGFKRLGVHANADTPGMIAQAIKFGAEGIGLCRTERMFNAPERLSAIREFILAETATERTEAVEHLRELQKKDFVTIFNELQGLPIIIRLLDLPLHEFLPPEQETKDSRVRRRFAELKETNPMLGHRGVRIAVTSPEIYKMQIEAIEQARAEVAANVAIMIPQVITAQEALLVKSWLGDTGLRFGVMIETVRACMRAGRLAEAVDFLSFGTNDLTQAVFSFSREDAEKKFLSTYLETGILQDNPFEVIDIKGVGRLMETAILWARRARKDIEIGVCGEQAAEPRSIRFFHGIGIDYVSCSPFRIPIAKLIAAQAVVEETSGTEIEFASASGSKLERSLATTNTTLPSHIENQIGKAEEWIDEALR